MSQEDNTIKTFVRVRPPLPREADQPSVVLMPDKHTTVLSAPTSSPFHSKWAKPNGTSQKEFTLGEVVWSGEGDTYVSNTEFYHRTSADLLNHMFQGYNVCLLAYGQTGSGKTRTMLGTSGIEDPGLVPHLVQDILHHKELLVGEGVDCTVRLSCYEIYNEQVRDLITDTKDAGKLRVREHPQTGPYVENCREVVLSSMEEFEHHLSATVRSRATAATSMNDTSSRSHAILSLTVHQTRYAGGDDGLGAAREEVVSNIKLVDLAGLERLSKTKAYGNNVRGKEGTLINQLLATLGRCINLLASGQLVIPYRDLVLTYLLKENLGGNSKTLMIFCISPVDFDETHHTLNYAHEVKKIKTKAVSNSKMLASVPSPAQRHAPTLELLRDQIAQLTSELAKATAKQQRAAELVQELELQLARAQFENKYNKQQLARKDRQISQVFDQVVDPIQHDNRALIKALAEHRQSQWLQLQQQIAGGRASTATMLQWFDPKVAI